MLAAARRSAADGQDPRYTLWQAWHRSGLQRRWLGASERGGLAGAQADRDLDAVTALFDVAEQYVTRTAGASLRGLVDHVEAMGLPATPRDQRPEPDAVAVLSAHAALGREWEFVVIAGLQEGLWPNTIPRGGVLGTQQLVDVMDGVATEFDRGLSTRAPLLAEERRLLIAAMGRARSRLLVTAVDSDSGDESMLPSPFCYELAALATDPDPDPPEPIRAPRVLAPPRAGRPAARGGVRSAGRASTKTVRVCAATQLARLAQAGVAGADPVQWYGMTPLSTDEPLWNGDDHIVTLSPSTLQTLTDCPLRWLLERHGGTDGRDVRSAVGSLLHALVADPGKTESQMLNELEKVWSKLPFDVTVVFGQRAGAPSRDAVDIRAVACADPQRAHRGGHGDRRRRRRSTRPGCGSAAASTGWNATARAGWSWSTSRPARPRSARTTRNATPSWRCTSWPSRKDCCHRVTTPGGGRLVYLGKTGAGGATEREQDALTAGRHAEWREQRAAGRGRHPGAGIRRADQRRLRALPGAGDVPGPGRTGGRS